MELDDIIHSLNLELSKVSDPEIVSVEFIEDTDARMHFAEGSLLLTADAFIKTESEEKQFPSPQAFDAIRNFKGKCVKGFIEKDKHIVIEISDGITISIDTTEPTRHEWIMLSAGGNSFAIA